MKKHKMMTLSIRNVLFLFVLCAFGSQKIDAISTRIIGGFPAEDGSAPYHVSLRSLANSHVCGGAIISKNAILSAGHCFLDGVLPEYVIAVLGTIKLSDEGERYNISQIIIHEDYSNESKENDIAIVTTSLEIIFTNRIRPIALWTRFVANGELLFTGFGDMNDSGNSPATDLMQIDLNVLEWDTCKRAYASVVGRKIFESQICTYNGFNEGTCKGDSGGPLVTNSALVGIASFGVPCAVGMPDVFTRTSDFIEWIQERVPTI